MTTEVVRHGTRVEGTVRACVIGATFTTISQVQQALKAVRATGTAGDIVGFAIPLPGDPKDPAVAAQVIGEMIVPRGIGAWFMTVLDPHKPLPTYAEQVSGRNVPLAHAVLGDLTNWIGAAGYMRVPVAGRDPVWIVGRPNHAVSVQGGNGVGRGDALVTIGIPAAQLEAFRGAIADGLCVVTTCETDPGRAERDASIMRRAGARSVFVHPLTVSHESTS